MDGKQPYLIVVTGRPGAGKTTLSRQLGLALHLPVISRDELKEGRLQTLGLCHSALPGQINAEISDTFFRTLEGLIGSGVSVLAEAAFQHRVWASRLESFREKARLRMVICTLDAATAGERFFLRRAADPAREYFHGDSQPPDTYDEPHLTIPTFYADTSRPEATDMGTLCRALLDENGFL